jgi:hypothetical protein
METKEIIASPMKYYQSPGEVLMDEKFDEEEKRTILTNWKDCCIREMTSEYEGMEGKKKRTTLDEINESLRAVKKPRSKYER